jgi:hypothetical protein
MSPISKKHLHFSAWPAEDRALWAAAFQDGDHFDEECRTAHMAAATKIGLRSAYARYLGYLTSEDPERLCVSVEARPDRLGLKFLARRSFGRRDANAYLARDPSSQAA